jgi:thiosulfate/3-mercaptopyruvate sulfurtransferase
MKKRLAAALAAPAVLLSGCLLPGYLQEREPLPVRSELLVSPNALNRTLTQPGTVVLHVGRDRASYDAGHVPGARFLALSSIVVEQGGNANELPSVEALDEAFEAVGVSDASRVVLYGDLDGLAAARAFFTLDYLGKENVALLNGGLAEWREDGHSVETAAPAVQRGTFAPRPRPEVLATAEYVRDRVRDSSVIIVDARPPAEFSGAEPGEGITRPGHIPGARNVFWRTTIVSPEDPELRSRDVLRALFTLAGARTGTEQLEQQRMAVQRERERAAASGDRDRREPRPQMPQTTPPGTTVVVYCRTGVQASMLYFVSRYLGYPTKMYDGSYADWSRRGDDFPVER